ncbi:MAG: ferrochelatase [Pseudomonadales bacterium]
MAGKQKIAIVLVNLGTPSAADAGAVRAFLKPFLSDARVIEGRCLRRWLWLAVLNFIVLRVRPAKVAKLYASIWQQGSPMRRILDAQVVALQEALEQESNVQVFSAMTYGDDSLDTRLNTLRRDGFERVLIVPMFPQYSATSTAPVYDVVAKHQLASRDVLDVRILKSYYSDPGFIDALAISVREHWQREGKGQKLLLSYHGIPQQYADEGDPYPQQCLATTAALRKALGEEDEHFYVSCFQSRFGPTQWVKPYTDETLESLAKDGVTSIDVICPAFSADCLETLEEMAVANKELFIEAGGQAYRYIPALNDSAYFIEALANLVRRQASDWLGD